MSEQHKRKYSGNRNIVSDTGHPHINTHGEGDLTQMVRRGYNKFMAKRKHLKTENFNPMSNNKRVRAFRSSDYDQHERYQEFTEQDFL